MSNLWSRLYSVVFQWKCLVINELGEQLIGGIHTLDNCYGLVPDAEIVYNSIQIPNEDLRYQKMGHANYKQLFIVSEKEAVLGIPKLVKVVNGVCELCQLGKHTRAHH